MQAKKLMTVCRSKYYMLKVNYPQLAELIDNEFAIPEVVEEEEINKVSKASKETVRVTQLAEQAEHLIGEDSKEAREAVYKKDKEDTKMYDEITQELIK